MKKTISLTYLNIIAVLLSQYKAYTTLYWSILHKHNMAEVGWSKFKTFRRWQDNSSRLRDPNRSKDPSCGVKYYRLQDSQTSPWTHFLAYWAQVRPKTNDIYFVHSEFRVMFMSGANLNSTLDLVSIRRIYTRWLSSHNLLLNLFYSKSTVQALTHKLFLEESLVFNWHYSYQNYKLFKYIQPFFLFSDTPHGGYIHSAIRLILKQKIDWLLIVDLDSHRNLISYLQKVNFYSIGLCPVNYSPWLLSYPIPSYSDSKLSQYYFFKWIFMLRSKADIKRFSAYNSLNYFR